MSFLPVWHRLALPVLVGAITIDDVMIDDVMIDDVRIGDAMIDDATLGGVMRNGARVERDLQAAANVGVATHAAHEPITRSPRLRGIAIDGFAFVVEGAAHRSVDAGQRRRQRLDVFHELFDGATTRLVHTGFDETVEHVLPGTKDALARPTGTPTTSRAATLEHDHADDDDDERDST